MAVADAEHEVVLVGHSTGALLVAFWAEHAAREWPALLPRVRGALLVAPSDPDGPAYPSGPEGFTPVPQAPLPFPSIVVASTNDEYVTSDRAHAFAASWGSRFVDIGAAGHINGASGLGDWQEGWALLEELRHGEALAPPPYYHGTRAALSVGDALVPGFASNYGQQKPARWVYFSATIDAAAWGAELAQGEGPERIYLVEPTGLFQHDPNLTNARFPGNPTKSYRTGDALRVVGELTDWQRHAPEQVHAMRAHLAALKQRGIEALED